MRNLLFALMLISFSAQSQEIFNSYLTLIPEEITTGSGLFKTSIDKKFNKVETISGIVYLYTETGIITKKATTQDSIFTYIGPVACPGYTEGNITCAVNHLGTHYERKRISIVLKEGGVLDEKLKFEFIPDSQIYKVNK